MTLRLSVDAITHFKTLAKATGISCQHRSKLYLPECAHSGKKLTLKWSS